MIPEQKTYEFECISDLQTWSTLDKLKVKKGSNEKPNIYKYIIYRVFSCPSILDIHFLSTSLWWGHSSIGVKNIETAFKILEDKTGFTGRIKIIVNTDFGKLFQKYEEDVINMADDFWRASNCSIRFYSNLRPKDYKLYIKTQNEEYYRIHFLNEEKKDGILAFSGEIKVKKMSYLHYKNEIDSFMLRWNSSIKLESKVKHLKDFGNNILDNFNNKDTYLKEILINHKFKTKNKAVFRAFNQMIDVIHSDSAYNIILQITRFLEVFCRNTLGQHLKNQRYSRLIKILREREMISSIEMNFLMRMNHLRNYSYHKAKQIRYKEDQIHDYITIALKITNHPNNS